MLNVPCVLGPAARGSVGTALVPALGWGPPACCVEIVRRSTCALPGTSGRNVYVAAPRRSSHVPPEVAPTFRLAPLSTATLGGVSVDDRVNGPGGMLRWTGTSSTLSSKVRWAPTLGRTSPPMVSLLSAISIGRTELGRVLGAPLPLYASADE